MPDLGENAVAEWLADVDPAREPDAWPPALRALETESDAPGLFEDLGRVLEQFEPDEMEALVKMLLLPSVVADLRAALAQAGAGRVFRILHWLGERDVAEPHSVVAALTEGSTQEARALRATISAFTQRCLLTRIFAPDRLAALHAATDTALKETTPCNA
jgi:hypothetical protein